jgi:ABC-type amino acid transport substrate-binding protein
MRHPLSKMILANQKQVVRIALAMMCLAMLAPIAGAESLYDRVLRTGRIRAAYVVNFPQLMKDPHTREFSGIGFDILTLATKRLGLKLDLTEEVTWGTMIEGLRTSRYDLVAYPVWANSIRARAADFSRPIYYSRVCAFTRFGDKRLDSSLKGLNDPKFKIATIDGEMAEMIAKSDFPTAKHLSLPQQSPVSDLLLSISTGKADVTFVEPSLALDFVKHNPKSIQNMTNDRPVRVFPNTYMFKTGEGEFKAMLNTALDEIAGSGELEKIIAKYELFPRAYLRCATPYQK